MKPTYWRSFTIQKNDITINEELAIEAELKKIAETYGCETLSNGELVITDGGVL